jgi:hypothetical protein
MQRPELLMAISTCLPVPSLITKVEAEVLRVPLPLILIVGKAENVTPVGTACGCSSSLASGQVQVNPKTVLFDVKPSVKVWLRLMAIERARSIRLVISSALCLNSYRVRLLLKISNAMLVMIAMTAKTMESSIML